MLQVEEENAAEKEARTASHEISRYIR